jgi:hypothetical protein
VRKWEFQVAIAEGLTWMEMCERKAHLVVKDGHALDVSSLTSKWKSKHTEPSSFSVKADG